MLLPSQPHDAAADALAKPDGQPHDAAADALAKPDGHPKTALAKLDGQLQKPGKPLLLLLLKMLLLLLWDPGKLSCCQEKPSCQAARWMPSCQAAAEGCQLIEHMKRLNSKNTDKMMNN